MIIQEAIAKAKKDIGVSSDDATIGSRYIYAIMKDVRSELLRQEIEKKGVWPGFPMQTLRGFHMEQIDMAEVDKFSAGIVGFRSKEPFPELMDTKEGKIFGGIFLPTLRRIDINTYTGWLNKKNRRYSYQLPSAIFRDQRLYIVDYEVSTPSLEVSVDGVYENPEEVERLNKQSCEPNSCIYYPEVDFYLPKYLSSRFFRIVRQELAITLGIPMDDTNNGKGDPQTAQIPKQNVENTS